MLHFLRILIVATSLVSAASQELTAAKTPHGFLNPFIGFVVAFVAAVVAIRWMVSYLKRHGLEIFGWYRIAVAGLTMVLLATGVI